MLVGNINAEQARAQGVESSLASSVTIEKSRAAMSEAAELARATSVESSLGSSISLEQLRATGFESSLATSISLEKIRAMQSESSLGTSVAAEALRAVAVESSISQFLAQYAASSTSLEPSRAIAAELNLSRSLALTDATIGTETQRAMAAEAAETIRASAVERQLNNSITSEQQRALQVEASLGAVLSNTLATLAQTQAQLASTQSTLAATQRSLTANLSATQSSLVQALTLIQSVLTLSATSGYTSSGLYIHYDFSNTACYPGSGTAITDLVGTQNGVVFNAQFAGSGVTRYFQFVRSAANTYVTMGSSIPSGQSTVELTLEAWAWHNSIGTDLGAIISSQNDGAGSWGASINTDGRTAHGGGPNSYHFQARVGGGYTTDSTNGDTLPNTVTTGQWVHVVVTKDSTGLKSVYQNGLLMTTMGTWAGALGWSNTRWQLGMQPDSNSALYRFYDGRIAIARIYNRALSAAEVNSNYNGQKARFGY